MLENTKGQSKNDNPEKLTTSGTQYEIKQSKAQHNVCWTPLCTHTHTHTTNVNKTCAIQQTTDKTGTKHRLCENDVNITNGVIFFTHHEQYYIDIHV